MSEGLCPNCGAAAGLSAGQSDTKCPYCESVITAQQAEAHFAKIKSGKGGGALLLANIALASCDYAKALTLYDKAIEQDGTSSEAWLGRGTCFVNERTNEYGSYRTKTKEALSSLDAAIQFAPNQQAMQKRAAKVIAEAVASGLRVEDNVGRKGSENFVYNDADYNALLEWSIEKDQGEFLLKTGAEFYSRATAYIDETELKESYYQKFATSVRSNGDKYLKALREMNPEAAGKCEDSFRTVRTAAQKQFQDEKAFLADIGGVMQESMDYRTELEKKLENRNKAGCFIATACYGSSDHPAVIELRQFRDDCLEASKMGRWFVRWYSKCSPGVADLAAKHRILKALARVLIVRPVAVLARTIRTMPKR